MYNRKFAGRVYRKLKRICAAPRKFIQAWIMLHTIIRRKSDDEFIIILSDLIGDTVYALAYLTALHECYPEKKIIVVGNRRLRRFLESYRGIDQLVLLDEGKWLDRKNASMQNSRISEAGLKYGIFNSNPHYYKKCYSAPNPETLYQLKTHIYRLHDSCRIDYPNFKLNGAITAIKDFESQKDRIVIINPYSNSLGKPTKALYEAICEFLIEKGFTVYTNVIGTQKPIYGSKELRCSMEELYSISCEIPAFISIRSGILDYLVSSGINMFVLYDNCTLRIKKMYSLTNWRCSGEIYELYPEDTEKEIDEIMEKLRVFINNIKYSRGK